ncbi:MAG: YraN family protein, partial [bacterium]|nr:YraN family protein [bacterium]
MNNISVGKNGENIAKIYLEKLGYKILETNKRFSRYCELDIIALDKNTLVFCEVKTRTTNICGSPFEAITKSKSVLQKTLQHALLFVPSLASPLGGGWRGPYLITFFPLMMLMP